MQARGGGSETHKIRGGKATGQDARHGEQKRDEEDLTQGFGVLPAWMQDFLRTIPGFDPMPPSPPDPAKSSSRRKPRAPL